MGMKLEKSPFRYVCDHKNRFMRRMAMPFAFRDWYGPKQLYKHICDDNPVNRKKVQATGTGQRRLQKFIFWLIFACRASKMSKNMKKSPFAYICDHKNCSRVIWPCQLFYEIAMILSKLANTHDMVINCVRKVLGPLEVVTGVRKTALFS